MTSGRDSLYGETIVWEGGPKATSVPLPFKIVTVVSAVTSLVALSFAVVVARGLSQSAAGLVLFSAWCATLALGAWRLPLWFQASVRYVVTDKHVIWRRGRLRRTMDRSAISYAVIRWNPRVAGVGDLVLERAVPTGALRRTLRLTFSNVEAPDRLWAVVRGVTPGAPLGDGSRPLAQRLDEGERVLWTASPHASRWTTRRMGTAAAAGATLGAFGALVALALPPLVRVLRLHALAPALEVLFVGGVALAALLLAVVAIGIGYVSIVRPIRLAKVTRYFVTDRRVLIRRGTEELHLDRRHIAYVITAPRRSLVQGRDAARRDLFLVLDGPQARAFSPSGAFGGPDEERLVPMFSAIDDADTATELLHVGRISLTEARKAA